MNVNVNRNVNRNRKYWFDTEFIDRGYGPIELISIGMVGEDGREYYAVNRECPLELADDWVRAHVVPQLEAELARPRRQIRDEVRAFVEAGGGRPEFWAYQASYDWVVLCQLFGPMSDLPEAWPRYCRDIKQLADCLGEVRLPEQVRGRHHALADARWNRLVWEYLDGLARTWFRPPPTANLG